MDGETEELGTGRRNLFKYHFVHHRCHMHWHGIKFRPVLVRGQQVELWHSYLLMLSHVFYINNSGIIHDSVLGIITSLLLCCLILYKKTSVSMINLYRKFMNIFSE